MLERLKVKVTQFLPPRVRHCDKCKLTEDAAADSGMVYEGHDCSRPTSPTRSDHAGEIFDQVVVPQLKLLDTVRFFQGVLATLLLAYAFGSYPNLFPVIHLALLASLLGRRLCLYYVRDQLLYFLEFCYFVNYRLLLNLFLRPQDGGAMFRSNYILAHGPLLFAVLLWRNALIFHSTDKMTSLFLHLAPACTCHLVRWAPCGWDVAGDDGFGTTLQAQDFRNALQFYAWWQVGYCLVMGVLLREWLGRRPQVSTSYRYLTKKYFREALRLTCGPDPSRLDQLRAARIFPAVYLALQISYTLVTVLPTALMWRSYAIGAVISCGIFLVTIWSGAKYYIQHLSSSYNSQFQPRFGQDVAEVLLLEDSEPVQDLDNHAD